MAVSRTALDFNFVALVLSVTGRVRPDDLQSIPEIERASLLHAYADANGASEPLHFEGDTLVRGFGAPLPTPPTAQPAPVAGPVATTPTTPTDWSPPAPPNAPAAGAPSVVSEVSEVVPGEDVAVSAFVSPASPGVPEFFADSAYTSATAAPAAVGVFAGAPSAAVYPGAPPSAGAMPLPAADGDFFGVPEAVADMGAVSFDLAAPDAETGDSGSEAEQPKVSFLFWLLPILMTWVGGIIAYFVVRPKNQKQAKTMLITGIALTVVYALIGVAGFFGLGMLAGSVVK